MKPQLLAASILALWGLPAEAADSDPCTEYVQLQRRDPTREAACTEWLDQQGLARQLAPGFAGQQGASAQASSSSSVGIRHVSATDLGLASNDQNEAFIAADPSPAGAGRLFVISKTHPFTDGLFAARSSNYGDTWTPEAFAQGPGAQNPPGKQIPAGIGDPWAVFTEQGTLYVSYLKSPSVEEGLTFGVPLAADTRATVVVKSSDGGATFG